MDKIVELYSLDSDTVQKLKNVPMTEVKTIKIDIYCRTLKQKTTKEVGITNPAINWI